MNRIFALLEMLTPRGARLLRTSVIGLWLPALLPALAAPHLGVGRDEGAERAIKRGVGLSVHPPVMLVSGVTPGVETSTPAPITIKNSGGWPIECAISPFSPSDIGMRTMSGYTDIPDPSWCLPAASKLSLKPGESKSVPVHIVIPEDRCYENRSWCVAISVHTKGAGTLGAAAYPYLYIETNNKQEPPRPSNATDGARALPEDSPGGTGTNPMDKPNVPSVIEETAGQMHRLGSSSAEAGRPGEGRCLRVSTGVLDAGDVVAGETASAGIITVENLYGEDARVELKPLLPDTRGLARNVLITPGHTWIKDEGWLRPCEQGLFLLAGKKAHFEIAVASPNSPSLYNYRWEGFLELTGPNGPEAVVRVRWRTVPPPAVVSAPEEGD